MTNPYSIEKILPSVKLEFLGGTQMNGLSAGNLYKFFNELVELGVTRRELQRTDCCRKVRLTYPDKSVRVVDKTEELKSALPGAISAKLI